jgi:hypothetical protein
MRIRAQSLYLQSEKRARNLWWQVEEMSLTGFWGLEWRVGGHGILPWAQSASRAKREIEAFFVVFGAILGNICVVLSRLEAGVRDQGSGIRDQRSEIREQRSWGGD